MGTPPCQVRRVRIAGAPDAIDAAGAPVLTGGDVAASVCRKIGFNRIDVHGAPHGARPASTAPHQSRISVA
ncbi:MAG TPA: hypothetical protein VFQ80_07975 [Thermomicrobiales bacterium]|nr:hypothetical protein [Thermomicrobiales bacterium]